ncbi:serine hydrolase domain-containing protein [Paenibacillus lemnae]|uniref:Serine hydrolase n=1 Tax=Paenibacillus lemnae TaxID=1330551 RepID=A0A848M2Y3_PAELE|nr:serine hydrolase [Paenibacillus lemnae]NMO94629.1 serine hydrolase [Paenibacillus lemnae]
MNPLQRVRPEETGIPPSAILRFIEDMAERNMNLHSYMLLRHGKVAAEGYFSPFQRDMRHPVFSVSKSFTSAAIGIAIGEGLLSLDDKVIRFFPDKHPEQVHPYTADMSIRHLLSMQTVHRKSTNKDAGDIVYEYLHTPPSYPPGNVFAYDTTGTHTLCAILQRVTGITVHEYLDSRLFQPLGMQEIEWETCPMGINQGGSGAYCTTEDMAKFGQLYLQDGVWNGIRILPEGWVQQSTSKAVDNSSAGILLEGRRGYGYQFWCGRHHSYCAFGAGGQLILVMPEQDAVFVSTANTMLNRDEHQGILDSVWTWIVPSMQESCERDDAHYLKMKQDLDLLKLHLPEGSSNSPAAREISGIIYTLEPNESGWNACSFHFHEECEMTLFKDTGSHTLSCPWNGWHVRPDLFFGMSSACGAVWVDEFTCLIHIQLLEQQQMFILTCRFSGRELVMQIKPCGAFRTSHLDIVLVGQALGPI